VGLVTGIGDFCVGVAAFPEGHVRAASREADVGFFIDKCAAGADFAITQMFFFTEDYLRFRDEVAARGCTVPIIAGIMPITSVPMIDRAVLLSGARFPADLADRLHAHADDRAAVRRIGVEYAAGMCQRLLDQGVPGLHFYTLNGSRATSEIYQALGLADRGRLGWATGSASGSTAPMTA
jgi:methylenetetrahydrofolate reductase (NADPH)